MKIEGKIAVVTGAAGGIGSGLAEKLVKEGVFCILIDRSFDVFAGLKKELNPAMVSFYACDFTDPAEVQKLATEISAKFKKIDFLFNVAGVGTYKSLADLSLAEWRQSLAINLDSPFVMSKHLLPNLKKADRPMIFNVGSGMGVIPSPGRSAYCASKFGLRGLSLSLSRELKDQNIDVCLLTLGSVMTSFGTGGIGKRIELQQNGKKYLEPGEVADKIIEMAKSGKREEEYVLYPDGYSQI